MDKQFDEDEARRHLIHLDKLEKEEKEKERIAILEQTIQHLKEMFSDSEVEVYLVGSITRPYKFSTESDIDIVLKNFSGDRFDVWTQIEGKIKRNVEVILYETCHFKDHIQEEGLKVL